MSSLKPNLNPSAWKPAKKLGGSVNFFQALGYSTAGTDYTPSQLSAKQVAPAVAAAQESNSSGSSNDSGNVSPSSASSQTLTKTEAANKALARQLASAYGWGSGSEWTALNNVVMAESGWNNLATNPSSGAFGIAQALPPTKYPQAGRPSSDGGSANAQAQIQWMLQYIKSTYGTPSKAWAHEQSDNWY